MAKQYDRAYFDKWYRSERFGSRASLERKVRYAVASAEYLLQRPVRSVLDVGCGEGAWQVARRVGRTPAMWASIPARMPSGATGRDASLCSAASATSTNSAYGTRSDLVVVCVDVIPYVTNGDAKRGLQAIGRRVTGVALIELFTVTDDFEGDVHGYHRRSPSTYRRWFQAAALERIGPNLFAGAELLDQLTTFERGG